MEFSTFIQYYKDKLRHLFQKEEVHCDVRSERDLPDEAYDEIRSCSPLSVFIPEKYGGRGAKTREVLAVLEASSYESLPLSLMMGINGALFLQPVINYANEKVKQPIIDRFLNENKMGGLMITEPDYGSDALHMKTN
ncbi:MAG TPA: acyl-CoA dehydrogenase family protein, partial [Balneolaceae bacterium]|nr:acyl-CoA dehydrogenase family protein [Balneolaceae bacterium]